MRIYNEIWVWCKLNWIGWDIIAISKLECYAIPFVNINIKPARNGTWWLDCGCHISAWKGQTNEKFASLWKGTIVIIRGN